MRTALAEPEIVTKKGKPVSVILPIQVYQQMVEKLQDAADIACLKKARARKLSFRSLDDYLAQRHATRGHA